jgi:hypothetical protein
MIIATGNRIHSIVVKTALRMASLTRFLIRAHRVCLKWIRKVLEPLARVVLLPGLFGLLLAKAVLPAATNFGGYIRAGNLFPTEWSGQWLVPVILVLGLGVIMLVFGMVGAMGLRIHPFPLTRRIWAGFGAITAPLLVWWSVIAGTFWGFSFFKAGTYHGDWFSVLLAAALAGIVFHQLFLTKSSEQVVIRYEPPTGAQNPPAGSDDNEAGPIPGGG